MEKNPEHGFPYPHSGTMNQETSSRWSFVAPRVSASTFRALRLRHLENSVARELKGEGHSALAKAGVVVIALAERNQIWRLLLPRSRRPSIPYR